MEGADRRSSLNICGRLEKMSRGEGRLALKGFANLSAWTLN